MCLCVCLSVYGCMHHVLVEVRRQLWGVGSFLLLGIELRLSDLVVSNLTHWAMLGFFLPSFLLPSLPPSLALSFPPSLPLFLSPFFEIGSYTLALVGLELMAVLLSQPSKHWYCRHEPPYLTFLWNVNLIYHRLSLTVYLLITQNFWFSLPWTGISRVHHHPQLHSAGAQTLTALCKHWVDICRPALLFRDRSCCVAQTSLEFSAGLLP